MPIRPIDRESLPYVRPAYEPDTRTLAQLMALAGQSRAQQIGRRGQARAEGLMTLGQLISQGLGSIRQDKERALANQAAMARQEQEDAFKRRDQQIREFDVLARIGDREEAAAARAEAAERQRTLDAQKAGDTRAKAIGYGPIAEMDVDTLMQSPERAGDVRYSFGPGTAEGPELQPTLDQRRGIETEKSIKGMGGVIGPNGQVVMPPKPEREPNPTEASLAAMAARGDKGAAKALEILRGMRGDGQERSVVAVIDPVTGKPKYVRPSDAVGLPPASNREQGRPVTSGDAGRIAELDTSLDDVSVLRGAVSGNKATGTQALVGSKLPNWVTEITGWGSDAKSKNAVIARVKQVIGKALEGGVLRKEDEYKYKDILPTIGDIPSVVTDKIDGLEKAIRLRRQRELDAREDAGYDVSKFRERSSPTPKAPDRVDELIKKYGGGS